MHDLLLTVSGSRHHYSTALYISCTGLFLHIDGAIYWYCMHSINSCSADIPTHFTRPVPISLEAVLSKIGVRSSEAIRIMARRSRNIFRRWEKWGGSSIKHEWDLLVSQKNNPGEREYQGYYLSPNWSWWARSALWCVRTIYLSSLRYIIHALALDLLSPVA